MLNQKIDETIAFLNGKTNLKPEIALVLGSGLGSLGDELEDSVAIDYEEIPHFMRSTAPGHKGRIIIGKLMGKTVLCMQGRFHYYEGYTMQQITYPIRVMSALGVKTLVLTNACGGLDTSFKPGDLMLISDHINYMGANPLIGQNEDRFGVRFPDMTHTYKKELREIAKASAKDLGIDLKEGVYIGYSGPSFETPAEIRMMQGFGGDAVGMSTVPEAIVASHCKMDVMAISCIANLAAGLLDVPLSGDDVIEVTNKAGKTFIGLLREILRRM